MNTTVIKENLRKILMKFSWGRKILRWRMSRMAYQQYLGKGDAKTVFENLYTNNSWGNAESVSGDGSTLEYTVNIREKLPIIVDDLKVNKLLDAPCGDYNWFQAIKWESPISYVGGDIVEPLIKANIANHKNDTTSFMVFDIMSNDLPQADLWLCRDCLFHLSEYEIFLVFDNFIKSDIPFILTSTHPECVLNYDIPTGGFRLLNLELPPFSLGKPVQQFDDWVEGFPVRHLALWKREDVKTVLNSNKNYLKVKKDMC